MTPIEKMAREAGFDTKGGAVYVNDTELTRSMERFVQAVAKRCAAIVTTHNTASTYKMREELAAAILAEFGLKETP